LFEKILNFRDWSWIKWNYSNEIYWLLSFWCVFRDLPGADPYRTIIAGHFGGADVCNFYFFL